MAASRTTGTLRCRRAKRLRGEDAVPCGLSSATTPRSSSCEAACLPAPRLDVEGVGVLPSTDGGGGRLPYAPPQRTRSAASNLPDRASLRPSVFRAPRRAPRPFLISIPSDRAVFRRTPEVAAAAARSPPRSGCRRHHCAPRLASYLRRTGPGSWEFASAHHEEVGGAPCNFPGLREFLRLAVRGP